MFDLFRPARISSRLSSLNDPNLSQALTSQRRQSTWNTSLFMRAGTADTLLRPATEPPMINDHVAAETANLRAAHFNVLRRNASISDNYLE